MRIFAQMSLHRTVSVYPLNLQNPMQATSMWLSETKDPVPKGTLVATYTAANGMVYYAKAFGEVDGFGYQLCENVSYGTAYKGPLTRSRTRQMKK